MAVTADPGDGTRPPDRAGASAVGGVGMLVLLGLLASFGPLSIDMYLPGLPAVARDLDASASAGQLTLSACLVGLATGNLVFGPISDALGRRRPLLVALSSYAVSSIVCALAPTIGILIVFRVLQGASGAGGIVIAYATVRDRTTARTSAAVFSLLFLVNGVAPIAAPVIGGQVLALTDWRGVFAVLASIGAALALAVALVFPESLPDERRHVGGLRTTLGVFRRLLGDRVYVACVAVNGFALAVMFVYIAGSSFALQGSYGVSEQAYSGIFALNGAGILVANRVGQRLRRRRGAEQVIRIGLAVSATGSVALVGSVLLHLGLPGVLPSLLVAVSSVGLVLPSAMALALRDHRHEAGSASALLGLSQYVVGGLAAPFAGIAGADSAVPMAVGMAALSIVGLGCAWRVLRVPGRRVSAAGMDSS